MKRLLKLRKHIHSNGIDWNLLKYEKFLFGPNSDIIAVILRDASDYDGKYLKTTKNQFISQHARILV